MRSVGFSKKVIFLEECPNGLAGIVDAISRTAVSFLRKHGVESNAAPVNGPDNSPSPFVMFAHLRL